MNTSFVYRHVRLDKNEVFYVGMGTEVRNNSKQRAYCRVRKNRYWMNITKSVPYEVEIMMDGLSTEEAMIKEREFIGIYGRKDLGRGTLVNLTDGGDYNLSKKHSEKQRQMSSERHSKKICQYDVYGIFIKLHPSAEKAAIDVGGTKSHICKCANLQENNLTAKGFVWRWYAGEVSNISVTVERGNDKKKVRVDKLDLENNHICSYDCLLDASVDTGIPKTQICSVLRGRRNRTKSFTWKYSTL